MKKITAIFFIFMYVFSTTGLHDLIKLNVLIDHYYETRLNDRSVTFSQFLFMHYVTDDHNDKDNDRDGQLPFKSTETCASGTDTYYTAYPNMQPMASRSFTATTPAKVILNDRFIDTGSYAMVWHPPKNA